MDQELITFSEFARRCRVTPSALTKNRGGLLAPAVVDKKIDIRHPAAIRYFNSQTRDTTKPRDNPDYWDVVALLKCDPTLSLKAIADHLLLSRTYIKKFLYAAKMETDEYPPVEIKETEPGAIQDQPTVEIDEIEAPAKEISRKPLPPKMSYDRGYNRSREQKKISTETNAVEVPEHLEVFADMTLRQLIEKFGTDTRLVDWLNALQKIEAIQEKRLKQAMILGQLVNRDIVKVGIVDPINSAHLRLLTDGSKTITLRALAMKAAGREEKDIQKYVREQISSFIRPVKSKIERVMAGA
jgi:hypothetical protein